ncbi:PAS domain-containing hybrid sensor histidine kinase/response regulator [Siphonobacter curvatus]|uniref:histidine kinase n=1 Tax=Siphonobacter curvatus TaxID=2094562 RepID=A0A2S7IPS6_9BACT|nr:PAS domain-containing sensor histidine kinase [Siphonobacter curvatus]PQA59669.1 histidine kinase [Siphonobacter curvatus]
MNTRDQSTPKEALRRFIFESAKDYAILTLDLDRRVTSWSTGAEALLGWKEEEIIGQLGDLFFVPEDRAQGAPQQEAEKALTEGQAENERWHLRKDQSRFYGSGMTTPLLNEQGLVIGLTKVMRDLTAQKQAEDALKEAHERMIDILESTTDAFYALDAQFHFTYVNAKAAQLWGRDRNTLLGKHSWTEFPNAVGSESYRKHYEVLETGKSAQFETMSPLVATWIDVNIFLSKGGGLSVFFRDITVRKQAQQALQEANRRKDEFLAMLAHELRNPMATLRNGLQILSMTDSTSIQTRTVVERMSRQTDHLVRMVDELLDVSRISQGKIHLQKERVNLVELVRQGVDSVSHLFQEKHQTLQVRLPNEPIEIEGDATRLVQVIINLLNNATRYTPEQGQIVLTLEHQGGEVVFRVEDNGIGLEPDQLSAIFDLFVQVDNSLARAKGGLGIGLTLVKRLVEKHGGKVEAQSKGLGQGSTFSVYLPTWTRAGGLRSEQAGAKTELTRRRILLIDDNADATYTLGMLLEIKGYEVHTINSGIAGLQVAQSLSPDVILLDIGMPDMDGYETCRQIRQQPWGHDLFIVAVSGYGQDEDKQKAEEAGFNRHLTKPVDFETLLQLLNSL